jgi:hypothetical protein
VAAPKHKEKIGGNYQKKRVREMKPDMAREKSEAVLKLLAARAAEEIENEYDRIEEALGGEELPGYVDAGFQKVFAAFSAEEKRKARSRRRGKILKAASIAVAVLGVSFTGLVASSEALRYRVFDLLFSKGDGYNTVVPYEAAEGESVTLDLHGYYYPEYIPDGYRPTESSKTGDTLLHIYFVDGNQNFIDFQQSPLGSHEFLIDSEGEESGQIDIGGETGFWNRHGDTLILFWTRQETGFILSADGLSVGEAAKIAESMAYRQ